MQDVLCVATAGVERKFERSRTSAAPPVSGVNLRFVHPPGNRRTRVDETPDNVRASAAGACGRRRTSSAPITVTPIGR